MSNEKVDTGQGNPSPPELTITSFAPRESPVTEETTGKVSPETDANVCLAHGYPAVAVDGVVNIGMNPEIPMPSEEQQRAGFYVENVSIFLSQYQGRYKSFTVIGEGKGGKE